MKIKTISIKEDPDDYDYRDGYAIQVNDREVFSVSDGEPEDNALCRNFNACYNIIDLMKMAHEAGAKGESLEIEKVEVSRRDF